MFLIVLLLNVSLIPAGLLLAYACEIILESDFTFLEPMEMEQQ